MRITNLETRVEGKFARICATITWEDCDRAERQIYFAIPEDMAAGLEPNPDAFLLAAIIPAMRHGERRVSIDGKVCPQLRNGLVTAMLQLGQWYGQERHRPVAIEATQGFVPPLPCSTQRTACFMSGGVDALATLRCNRLDFPLDHPGSIRDCLLVHGIDLGGYEGMDSGKESFAAAVTSLSELARSADATLIPTYTNARHLDDSDALFAMESHGAVLAAIAHAFGGRITTVLIASSMEVFELTPWGTHPLLDPNYSSAAVAVRHDAARLGRLEKVKLIAEWDVALAHLRSCYHPFRSDGVLNCGKCEKCLRTMTELLVLGKLSQCTTFPSDNVTREMLDTLQTPSSTAPVATPQQMLSSPPLSVSSANAWDWRQLIQPLEAMDRNDLAAVLKGKLADCERFEASLERDRARLEERDWRGVLKRLDRRYAGGRVGTLYRLLRGRTIARQT